MYKRLFSIFLMSFLISSLVAQDISGDWYGSLEVSGARLRLVMHILPKDSAYTATMDSPDQGAYGIPATSVDFKAPVLNLKIGALLLQYTGTLNIAGDEISGTFMQGGASFPLKLQRKPLEAPAAPARPQHPVLPYPYYTEEVSIENSLAGISLSGTLSLPAKSGKYPVAVLVSGSGPQNRDEEILGHKPFLVIADFLVRQGIGILRFDDRGVGKSEGNFQTATTADFTSDVEAAIDFLKSRADILPGKIGIIGHSEGGLIAPMVAANSPKDVAFIISLAGPGVEGTQLLFRQQDLLGRASGIQEAELEKSRIFNERAYGLVKAGIPVDSARVMLYSDFSALVAGTLPKDQLEGAFLRTIATLYSPWFRYFLGFDPASVWSRVQCPVFALNGEKDLQVDPAQNLPAIAAALKKARNRDVTLRVFPGLNHLFQHAEKGTVEEYGEIEETFAPEVLEAIGEWLKKKI